MTESLIDDITLQDETDEGQAILFPNPEIRRMMHLAHVDRNDVFFDLGCGYGQNIKIALTEFGVKKAVGFEKNLERNKIANERLKKLEKIGIEKSRWEIRKENFEDDLLKDRIKDLTLRDATVIFYGLSTSKSFLRKLETRMRKGCRLICYYGCLFPEILPDKSDFPFYLYKFPFRKTTSEKGWLQLIVQKKKSSFPGRNVPSVEEMWDELRHDYDVYSDPDDVKEYKKRLKKALEKK